MNESRSLLSYVLITPAHNESAFIEKTIESMIRQTVLPLKWVIVDDGSTDSTAKIVESFLPKHPWMELVRRPRRPDRSFAGKAHAVNAGCEQLAGLGYEIIGNLDGDISFGEDHFEFLLAQFACNPRLGVAGTVFREDGYDSATDSFEGFKHVPGQCQLFRRSCWEEIGGYVAHRAGGVDWMAVITARMLGWQTRSFRERAFFHHRPLGTAERSPLSSLFSYGEKDYYLGGHPIWEFCRVGYRCIKPPYVVGGCALGAGFVWALVRRTPRPVPRAFVQFHRREQMTKLKAILKRLLTFKKIDSFAVSSD